MRSVVSAAMFGAAWVLGTSGSASAQLSVKPSDKAAIEDMARRSLDGIRIDKPVVGPGPQSQGSTVVGGVTLDEMLAMSKEAGLDNVEIREMKDQKKFVVGNSNGVTASVYPWECKNETCSAVSYYAYFGKQDEVDDKFITAFNIANIMKLVRYDNGNVVLMNTLKAYGGVTREHVQQMTRLFVGAIKTVIDFKPS